MTISRIPSVEGGIQPTVLTTTGDILYASSASNPARLGIGSSAQVLTVSGGIPAWATPASSSPLTTKGDVYTFTTTDARLAVGANNTFLRANSATATGLEYADAYTSYTPTFSNVTTGNGTITGKYMRVGKMCQGEAVLLFGSTTSITGIVDISLPFTSTTSFQNPILCTLLDTGTAVMPGLAYLQSSTTIRVVAINTAGTYATETQLSASVPFTWANGDRINVNFCFEVA